MGYSPQIRVPATYMRGGTSKGVFFRRDQLPEPALQPGNPRDAFLLRVIGSPDQYGKHTDGMGGATSSTSKVVILDKSDRPDHDIDYLFGQVAIDKAVIDWSGNCGNLTAAVGAFAINSGLIGRESLPLNGTFRVRIWQKNIGQTIYADVPVANGEVQESGDFELDGVTFPAAEVPVTFVGATDAGGDASSEIFPTGNLLDRLKVPGIGEFDATYITAGIPTIFVRAKDIGYAGTELQEDINNDEIALQKFEAIRTQGALAMGLISSAEEAKTRQHTPKIAFVSPPAPYKASSGKAIGADDTDLLVRALSMGKLHHAMMGTAAVAIATAAAIPGTLVNEAAGGVVKPSVTFGHPSGTLEVGAKVSNLQGHWQAEEVRMSRSARVLMEGWVRVPADVFDLPA